MTTKQTPTQTVIAADLLPGDVIQVSPTRTRVVYQVLRDWAEASVTIHFTDGLVPGVRFDRELTLTNRAS